MHNVATEFVKLRTELRSQFQEMDDTIEACLLAVVSGEHVFMLGMPGVAKTRLNRAIMSAITGARKFEVELSPNRPLEAVIGPLDILHFRETGEYRYRRTGYATDSEFVLFNEIGKMSADLGNDLLALLNERLILEVRPDGQGGMSSKWPAPLSTAFCDSNEELTSGSDDASALWDRLLVRDEVKPVVEDTSFVAMLKSGDPVITARIEWADLKHVIDTEVPAIEVPEHVMEAMVKLRRELAEAGVNPSPRRFRWSMKVLKASAFLAGRDEVTPDDIANLRFTLWDTVDQRPDVAELCRSKSSPFIAPLADIRKRLNELKREIEAKHKRFRDAGEDWTGPEGSQLTIYGKEVVKKCEQTRTELDAMLIEAGGRPIPTFKDVHELQQSVLKENFRICLAQKPESAEIMAQTPERIGMGDGGNV